MFTQNDLSNALADLTAPEQRYLIRCIDYLAGNRDRKPQSELLNVYKHRKVYGIARQIVAAIPA